MIPHQLFASGHIAYTGMVLTMPVTAVSQLVMVGTLTVVSGQVDGQQMYGMWKMVWQWWCDPSHVIKPSVPRQWALTSRTYMLKQQWVCVGRLYLLFSYSYIPHHPVFKYFTSGIHSNGIYLSFSQASVNPNYVAQDCNFKAGGRCFFKHDWKKQKKSAYLVVQVSHCTFKWD